jgi:CRISPR system Cascade subunit CasA
MNLLEDKWLSVIRRNGEQEKLAGLWQIAEGVASDNPIVDIVSPRADFKGALYQLFIGLVQTTFAPENDDAWENYWRMPPTADALKSAFLTVSPAFVLDTDKPAFMQDYNLLDNKQTTDIASLLIDTSGGGTFFIKEGNTQSISPYWAGVALFTLQINAPSGGSGHRTSLRGGGPVTTLVLPDETAQAASLWHKLWLNILTQKEAGELTGNPELTEWDAIFPWLAPTRTSEVDAKTLTTSPRDGHPYQMYWAMPRRIRLDFSDTAAGECDISHESCETLIARYRTKNLGVNYSSAWQHPLTPYVMVPEKDPYSVKAQIGGFGYRHWLGMVLGDEKKYKCAAKVVSCYLNNRRGKMASDYQPRLWVFGYDTDNMKARCWYETLMPIVSISPECRLGKQALIGQMLDAATRAAADIRSTLKQAWFSKPKEVKGEISFTDTQFWQLTEMDFYCLLAELINHCDDEQRVAALFKKWLQILHKKALAIFDHWALSNNNEDNDLKRVVNARNQLEKWLNNEGRNIGMSDENKEEATEKVRYNVLWREQEQRALLSWWQNRKQANEDDWARLRRCEKPADVLLEPAFYELQQLFPKIPPLTLAAIAGLLASIKTLSQVNFPRQLGQQKERSGKAIFSEPRFQQLLDSRTLDELYENLRHAVMHLNHTANILSLADGILHWAQEQHDKSQVNESPERRFQFIWAKAYFSQVLVYSKQ